MRVINDPLSIESLEYVYKLNFIDLNRFMRA